MKKNLFIWTSRMSLVGVPLLTTFTLISCGKSKETPTVTPDKSKDDKIINEKLKEFEIGREELKKITEFEKQITDFEKKVEKIDEDTKFIEEKIKNFNKKISDLSEKINDVGKRIKDLDEQNDKIDEKMDDLVKKIDELTTKVAVLKEKITNREKKIEDPNQKTWIDKLSNNKVKKFKSRINLSNVILKTDWSKVDLSIKKDRLSDNYYWSESMNNYAKNQGAFFVDNNGEVTSSLASKIIDEKTYELEYIPYADIGIVEDSVEYLLKNKGLPAAFRTNAEESLKKLTKKENHGIIKYNDLSYFKKQKIANKFNIGFMQNEYDNSDLSYAWNAVPKNDANQSGNWFQKERWDKWTNGGVNSEDLTITFGPFANAYWHTAFQNNYTEIDLARSFKEMSDHFGTKSFDFYFASPYNAIKNTDYASSMILLAGALKILLEQDSNFKVRLSLVAADDGFTIPGDTTNFNQVGDDMAPLWYFTKYLGLNFNLNLVTQYFTPDRYISQDGKSLINENWEIETIKKSYVQSKKTWTNLINHFGKTNFKADNALIKNRLSITTWPGKRPEKATWDFTPEDAKNLREFAVSEGIHSISSFYISRDNPSVFSSKENATLWSLSDLNPIDTHLRNGKGYESLTYSKILNGSLTEIPQEKTASEDILALEGALDWKKWIIDNEELDPLNNHEGGNWVVDKENVISENKNSQKLGKHLTWKSANPNRENSVTTEVNSNGKTYYSPYVDVGLLWSSFNGGSDKDKQIFNKLSHLTLAFVQQNNLHDENLDLRFAGYYRPDLNSGEDNSYFINNQFKPKILDKIKNVENLTISYGGFATGDNDKNPWHTAYNLAKKQNPQSTVEELVLIASNLLQSSLIEFNKNIGQLISSNKHPLHIDFDIEGAARDRIIEIEVLAKTLAKMKKDNSQWKFSITLPVLPSGITQKEQRIMEIFTREFKAQNLSVEDLPILNIMAMDYGVGIYSKAIKDKKTNFDLAKEATEKTISSYQQIISQKYPAHNKNVQELVGVTPMIGVNDHQNGVFTLEDAKEFYNWVHEKTKLNYISIWSLNCDSPSPNENPSIKTIQSHGLNYLYKYDFSKVFLGNWTSYITIISVWDNQQNKTVNKPYNYVLNPRRNPFNVTEEVILK